ncbi:hypothetical protein C8J56DRAFT_961501 [Mycena floridula]|nr:hypothetical protein C8J56DRAFT_961501 [Mycena floridula]
MTKEASTMSIDSGKYIQWGNTSRASTLLAFQISPFATHLDAIPSTETNQVHFMLLCSGSTLLRSLSHGLLFWYDKGAPVTYCTQMNAVAAFAWIEWLLITFALIIVLFRGFAILRRGDGWDGWCQRVLLPNEEQAIKLDEEKGRVTPE